MLLWLPKMLRWGKTCNHNMEIEKNKLLSTYHPSVWLLYYSFKNKYIVKPINAYIDYCLTNFRNGDQTFSNLSNFSIYYYTLVSSSYFDKISISWNIDITCINNFIFLGKFLAPAVTATAARKKTTNVFQIFFPSFFLNICCLSPALIYCQTISIRVACPIITLIPQGRIMIQSCFISITIVMFVSIRVIIVTPVSIGLMLPVSTKCWLSILINRRRGIPTSISFIGLMIVVKPM